MAPEPHLAPPARVVTDEASAQPRRSAVRVTDGGWRTGDVAVRAAGDMVQVYTRFDDRWWIEGGRPVLDDEVAEWVGSGEAVAVRVQADPTQAITLTIDHDMHQPSLDCCPHKSAEAIRWHCPGCDWTASEAFSTEFRREQTFADRHGYLPPMGTPVDRDPVRAALAHLVLLKDGPRDDAYRAEKEGAWQAARDALTHTDRSA